MKKLPVLLIVGSMLICGSVAYAHEINEEYVKGLIHPWAIAEAGSSCQDVMGKVEALDADKQLALRDLLYEQLSSEYEMPADKSPMDYRFARKMINQIDE